jgi:transcriptional regulator with XRE-family HTH domain
LEYAESTGKMPSKLLSYGNGKMEENMTLADKLKEARKNAGLTQSELAEKICVSRQAITKWETGKGIPDVDNLKVISKVLNVSIDFLLDDEEELDKTVIKEQINLEDYVKEGKIPEGRHELGFNPKF